MSPVTESSGFIFYKDTCREKGIRAKGYPDNPQKDDPSLCCLKESMWTVCSCSNAAGPSFIAAPLCP